MGDYVSVLPFAKGWRKKGKERRIARALERLQPGYVRGSQTEAAR